MARVLTSDQVEQVINNTMVVMLVRPDLMSDWSDNLSDLLTQAREARLDEESIFVAAVLTLLYSPEDNLPTGTTYDPAWQSLLSGLRTGVRQPAATQGERMTLDRLLNSISEAVIAVLTRAPDQKPIIAIELNEMREAAVKGQMDEMVAWIDNALEVLNGAPPQALASRHQGVYAAYWDAIVRSTQDGE